MGRRSRRGGAAIDVAQRFELEDLMNRRVMYFASLAVTVFLCAAAQCESETETYIENGDLRLGVDLESGGSIVHFSRVSQPRNLLNRFDRGRFIQQSYYGDSDGSQWWGKEWRWNPVQGGDCKGHPARLIECGTTPTTIHTMSTPKHWATGEDVTSATMEEWITLEDDVAHIRYKFTYDGDRDHEKRHQELPAVFVDYDLPNLVYYQGEKPWTNDALTRVVPGWPNEGRTRDECWAAYVDDKDWGIGVYTPGTKEMTCYRFKGDLGPKGSGCSYFAPVRTLAITKGFTFDYDVYLTIGAVNDIRSRFNKIYKSSKLK